MNAHKIALNDNQWRERLTAEQFRILRQHGTEAAGSSPLNKETCRGVYACAGCGQLLFGSVAKYDSGTGWPSFYEPLADAVGTQTDWKLLLPRTEVHCGQCGGHLGHVFNDGPAPTGKRYCVNGTALVFMPAGYKPGKKKAS